MHYVSIAIDGPAGAGKSTISKILSARLGYMYIDTGAMYRAAALYAIERGINIKTDRDKLLKVLGDIDIDLHYKGSVQKVLLCGEDVSQRIRENDVSIGSSDIAVIPEVRKMLVDIQRNLANNNNVIMDGRDIGTHVLPNADLKLFLTASVDDRAERRYKEMLEKGMKADFKEIRASILYRDKNDSERKTSPLKQADDALLVDTTGNTLEQSVEKIYGIIMKNIKAEE
jgi:cytidylate kinase